ncbi:MAG: hypothetical protein COA42_20470 [Alteromonadaceae bacterium]|nr:MAG: hypothetical protein COA42_20470 [Alteromonadaceae bacterium]
MLISTKPKIKPYLAALCLGFVLPTLCIMWFMYHSMQNERIATEQKLKSIYYKDALKSLAAVQQLWNSRTRSYFEQQASDTNSNTGNTSSTNNTNQNYGKLFSEIIQQDYVDSVILWKPDGQVAYPNATTNTSNAPIKHPLWQKAQHQEFYLKQHAQALQSYKKLKALIPKYDTQHRQKQAKILLAMARNAYKLNQLKQTGLYYQQLVDTEQKQQALDSNVRSTAMDARLRIAELNPNEENLRALATQLNDYQHKQMPASQRLFIAQRALAVAKQAGIDHLTFPTIDAEQLAQNILKNKQTRATLTPRTGATTVNSEHIALHTKDKRITLLVNKHLLADTFTDEFQHSYSGAKLNINIISANDNSASAEVFMKIPLNDRLEGLTFVADWQNRTTLHDSITAKTWLFLWTGSMVIAILIISSIYVAYYMNRQEKLHQLKNDVVATVSHELKTPLTSIRLLIDNMLEDSDCPQQTVREYIEIISRENIRLTHLVDNFLTYSRVERDQHNFYFDTVQAEQVIDESLEVLAEKFKQQNVTLHKIMPKNSDEILFEGDKDMLKTALINLLDNACKYSSDDKHITLECQTIYDHKNGSHIVFSVTDKGIGLSKKDCQRVFNRFFRADPYLNRKTEGCGLGLYIAAYIARAHNGRIDLQSTLGQGSTFSLLIPTTASTD